MGDVLLAPFCLNMLLRTRDNIYLFNVFGTYQFLSVSNL